MSQYSPKMYFGTNASRPSALVVDNRVFLLGLDYLYRAAMKIYESQTLLNCAREVAGQLGVSPSDAPVEGYYSESPALETYFRLMRALQLEEEAREAQVKDLPAFQLLWNLTNSPLFGRPERGCKLLPVGRDPLAQALLDVKPWHVEPVTERVAQVALAWDDFSLVGLAARVQDAVVITALRETMVLYAGAAKGEMTALPETPYRWEVDAILTEAAGRFIAAFHRFVPGALPPAEPASAEVYYQAYAENEIIGRCVRIGSTGGEAPYYHWAVAIREVGPTGPILRVDDFWSEKVWSTDTYRDSRRYLPGKQ